MYFHVFPCIKKIMRYKKKELKNKLTYIRKNYIMKTKSNDVFP